MMNSLVFLSLVIFTLCGAEEPKTVKCGTGRDPRMAESCNKCADASSAGIGCEGECMWNGKIRTCIHVEDEVLAPVDCGYFTAPTCRQCRSDDPDFSCRGVCIMRPERPERPDPLRCTWEGRDFKDDRDNSVRRDIFAKELVAAVNKFRKNNNTAELRRDENGQWLNKIATAIAKESAQNCDTKSKRFPYKGKNNVQLNGLKMATCDKFPAGTDLVFGNHPWKQFEHIMLRSFVGRLMGVGVSRQRCSGCDGDEMTFVVAMFY